MSVSGPQSFVLCPWCGVVQNVPPDGEDEYREMLRRNCPRRPRDSHADDDPEIRTDGGVDEGGNERRVTLFYESGEPFQIRVDDYEPLASGHTAVIAEDGREYLFSPGSEFYIRHRPQNAAEVDNG